MSCTATCDTVSEPLEVLSLDPVTVVEMKPALSPAPLKPEPRHRYEIYIKPEVQNFSKICHGLSITALRKLPLGVSYESEIYPSKCQSENDENVPPTSPSAKRVFYAKVGDSQDIIRPILAVSKSVIFQNLARRRKSAEPQDQVRYVRLSPDEEVIEETLGNWSEKNRCKI